MKIGHIYKETYPRLILDYSSFHTCIFLIDLYMVCPLVVWSVSNKLSMRLIVWLKRYENLHVQPIHEKFDQHFWAKNIVILLVVLGLKI